MLRNYQIELSNRGLLILRQHSILYLCFEVRTGKTLTSLATANKYGAKKVLFLTKKKAIASIQKDFKALAPGFDLYIANYESVHTITEDFDLVILDEAHCLSAFPKIGERTKLVKKLCEGKPIIYLSGSPTPESHSQIFHQLHCSSFSPFKEYKNFYKWAADYVFIKQRRFSQGLVNDYSQANKQKIDKQTKHLFISYTQAEAGFKQMVIEHVFKVKMQPTTYSLAASLRARRVFVSSKSGKTVVADTEVKLMQKLHQIYSGTVICEDGEVMCFDNSKAEAIAKKFAGQKIAVFYKFRGELELLRWAFRGMITESPEEFNQSTELTCCLQIQSGREGTNLSTADALVFYNIDFAHVSYLQAKARLQTMERQKACDLYWVFAEGGIEEKILEKVKAKQDYQLSHFRRDFKVEEIKKVA
jgi:superfamily II DNA or RNA helicase